MESPAIDDLDRVTADVVIARKRLAKLDASKLDVKSELLDNLYPLFEGFVEATKKRFDMLEEDLNYVGEKLEEIEESGEQLHPETTQQIIEVFALGDLLATELEQIVPKLDDLAKKRVRQIVKSFRQGVVVVSQVLAEITIPLEPEDAPKDEKVPPGEEEEGGELEEGDDDELEDIAADGGEG